MGGDILFGDDLSRTALAARYADGARITARPADHHPVPDGCDLLFVLRGDGHLEPATRTTRPSPRPGEIVVLLSPGRASRHPADAAYTFIRAMTGRSRPASMQARPEDRTRQPKVGGWGMAQASHTRRVVIVGGGFARLFAARTVSRAPVQVILLDRAEHHLFQPMLYQCATGIVSEGKIATPLRELLKKRSNVTFMVAEATGIDPGSRKVQARRPLGEQIELSYDYLVLAAGVRQSDSGMTKTPRSRQE